MVPRIDLPHPERADITLENVLFALSDTDRLALARQLEDGPMNAAGCEPGDAPIPKSTKSHMMKVLREAGVIRNEPAGRNRRLELRRCDLDARFPGLLTAILHADARPPAA